MVSYLFLRWIKPTLSVKSFYSNTEFTCFSAIAVIYHRRYEHELRDKNGLKSERAEFAISVICVEPCAHSSKYVFRVRLANVLE